MKNHFDADEARRRLTHLASMPETSSRRCEMAALRRVLEMDLSRPSDNDRPSRISTVPRKRKEPDYPDEPEKPLREVSRTAEGRKKVVIRKSKTEKTLKDESREDRERMKRIKDFRATLNQGF